MRLKRRDLSCAFRVGLGTLFMALGAARAAGLDLTEAVVVAPPNLTPVAERAVAMLIEEVEKRSQVRWPRAAAWPAAAHGVIAVGPWSALEPLVDGRLAGLRQGQRATGLSASVSTDCNFGW